MWQQIATRATSPQISAGVFSCVVDSPPRFHREALRWFAALTRVAGVSPTDLVIHAVNTATSPELTYLKAQGVAVHSVPRFDSRSPHCNKISGALHLSSFASSFAPDALVVLMDTDVVVLEDLRAMAIPPKTVASKPVDLPNPPVEILENLFRTAGVSCPPRVSLEWMPGQPTLGGNGNGGLYLVPGPILSVVAQAWARWALWLLDRPDLLGKWVHNVDQVAMCIALADEDIEPLALQPRWNLPIHLPAILPKRPPAPAAIHYHNCLDKTGNLLHTGHASIDGPIDIVNAAIREVVREAAPETDMSRPAFRATARVVAWPANAYLNRRHSLIRMRSHQNICNREMLRRAARVLHLLKIYEVLRDARMWYAVSPLRSPLAHVGRATLTDGNHDLIITGIPRSGTSYLCSLLDQFDNSVAINEPVEIFAALRGDRSGRGMARLYRDLRRDISQGRPVKNKVIDGVVVEDTADVDIRRKYVPTLSGGNPVLATKNTLAYMARIESLRNALPSARIVACVRDPFATIASWKMSFQHLRNADVASIPIGNPEDPQLQESRRHELRLIASTESPAERRALWWRYLANILIEYRDDIILVRYADLIASPAAVLSTILAGIDPGELRAPLVQSEERDKTSNLDEEDLRAIQTICFEAARELGVDYRWGE